MAVYFIRADGTNFVKIGFAISVARRSIHLQAGCPHKLVLVRVVDGDRRMEAACHALFAEHHVDRDWFTWSPRMANESPAAPDPLPVMSTGSFSALIDDLGGPFAAARKTGIGRSAMKKMRARNRIAAKHWPTFIALGVPMEHLIACERGRTA